MNIYFEHRSLLSARRIKKSFVDHAPDFVNEVTDWRQADLFFFYHTASLPMVPIPNEIDSKSSRELWKKDKLGEIIEFMQLVKSKPRIFWLDTYSQNGQNNTIPNFTSENDILTAPIKPAHPQGIISQVICPDEFHCIENSNRFSKSVLISPNHTNGLHLFIKPTIVPELESLMDAGLIQTIFACESSDKYLDMFGTEHWGKIIAKKYREDAMTAALNRAEYTLQTQINVGMELTGLEGGFCGAQPIYPDTPYYRDLFGNDLGVAFIDTTAPLESLTDIFSRPLEWREKHMQKFIDYFSAKEHIPKFWNKVKSTLNSTE